MTNPCSDEPDQALLKISPRDYRPIINVPKIDSIKIIAIKRKSNMPSIILSNMVFSLIAPLVYCLPCPLKYPA